jgi:hypothetical protein
MSIPNSFSGHGEGEEEAILSIIEGSTISFAWLTA